MYTRKDTDAKAYTQTDAVEHTHTDTNARDVRILEFWVRVPSARPVCTSLTHVQCKSLLFYVMRL